MDLFIQLEGKCVHGVTTDYYAFIGCESDEGSHPGKVVVIGYRPTVRTKTVLRGRGL